MTQKLIEVENLKKYFPITAGLFKRTVNHVRAVDGVSFHINRGETLGLVGESGCGKTTTGRLMLRLLSQTEGDIFMNVGGKRINLASLQGERLRVFRRQIQMIFQDPYSSLNPRLTVLDLIAEPLRALTDMSSKDIRDRVRELLELVGLKPEFLRRFPHAFSGGQRQRLCIARALALNPKLIVCDEPVSALDVSVQAQIINLLKDLQERMGLTYLFIAHDLSVVENISSRVAVMYAGRIVESARTEALFSGPRHPYTGTLLRSVPSPDPRMKEEMEAEQLPGEVADPSDLPPGCAFHPRCRFAVARCREEVPPLRNLGDEHYAACHRAEEVEIELTVSAAREPADATVG